MTGLSHQTPSARTQLPAYVRVWFGADLILVLTPPLHWWASGATPILGVPRVLAYLFGSSICIVAGLIVAYLTTASADRGRF